jgi:hypothetical protein
VRIYIFGDPSHLQQVALSNQNVLDLIHHICSDTETSSLVIAIYMIPGFFETRGIYIQRWMRPELFTTGRGKWYFTKRFSVPDDLPDQYRLIRLRIDGRSDHFPREEKDSYGWTLKYKCPGDQLALLFCHELHHYRRYHLNFHPGEGEYAANRWALSYARSLGYDVSGYPVKKKRKTRFKNLRKLFHPPTVVAFRNLKPGDRLLIRFDSKDRYTHQPVTVVRPVRSNAGRIVVETSDGRQWRWPISWLSLPDKTEAGLHSDPT